MNGIAEISATWRWWNACVSALRMFPESEVLQRNAARAQMQLVCTQALYLGGSK